MDVLRARRSRTTEPKTELHENVSVGLSGGCSHGHIVNLMILIFAMPAVYQASATTMTARSEILQFTVVIWINRLGRTSDHKQHFLKLPLPRTQEYGTVPPPLAAKLSSVWVEYRRSQDKDKDICAWIGMTNRISY